MQIRIGRYNGPSTVHEVKFTKYVTSLDSGYEVDVDGEYVGRIVKATTRSYEYAGRSRIANGFTERTGWKAEGVRYAVVEKTRLDAVATLLGGSYGEKA